MKRYIKIDNDNNIIDLFFEHQKKKFDGSEILLDDLPEKTLTINNKYRSDEYGVSILKYGDYDVEVERQTYDVEGQPILDAEGAPVFETVIITSTGVYDRPQAEIDSDPKKIETKIAKATAELTATDVDIPRGCEDIMDILDSSNVLKKDVMPQEFQDKLTNKKLKRAELQALING